MIALEGIGIHSGRRCRVTLHRIDGPVRFRRSGRDIPAAVDAIVDSRRATTLGADGARVGMVEHLLAALAARSLWSGVLIEASSDELPILDGSARAWYDAVADLPEPPAPPEALRPARSLRLTAGEAWAELDPGGAQLCCGIHYDHPAIGEQRWCGGPARYPELVDARTFGLRSEEQALRARGLASGANLENVIVYDEEGPLVPLRAENEPVRHKALDALGDLFLFGRPLEARVSFWRGSHALHAALLRELLQATPEAALRP